MDWRAVWLLAHLAGVVVWVGGMFFAYVCLRPVAAAQLPPPQRLALWAVLFERFFVWVWVAIFAILASGLAMIMEVGFAAAPLNWHLMFGAGVTMMFIFLYVFFVPFPLLKAGVARQDWPRAGDALGAMRRWIGVNLSLGFVTIAFATLGRLIG